MGIRLTGLLVLSILFFNSNSFADKFGPLKPCSDILKELATNGCHQCSGSEIQGCTSIKSYIFKKELSCCTENGRFDVDGYSYSEYQCPSGGIVYCCALLGSSGISDSRCPMPTKSQGSENY